MATGAVAQVDPNNMFIHGYILDVNGQAIANHEVCAFWQNDSLCATTNANGYYYLEIVNGSVTGPNITYTVQSNDTCAWLLLQETVINGQGTVDIATVDFTFCGSPGSCDVYVTTSQNPVDPSSFTLTAVATGVAPFSYVWDNNQTGQSATYQFNQPGVYGACVTITDATGCTSWNCDTIVFGNNPCNLQVDIVSSYDSINNVYTVDGGAGFSSYLWSNNSTTQTTTIQNPNLNGEVICLSVTDANGCTASACDTLLPLNNGGCQAGFNYPTNPSGALVVGNSVQLFFDGVSGNNSSYVWTLSAGGLSLTAIGMNPVFQIPPTLLPLNGMMVEICVTVSDSLTGCTDSYCETVLAVPANTSGCQAYYTWAPDSMLGSPLPAVWFSDYSSNAASWYWDFGDNTFSTAQNPLHSYSGTGTYTVCLTIVSADSLCQDTYCETVYVGSNTGNCDASFSNSGPTPIGYTFSANVQDPNFDYEWTIDNQFVGNGYDAYAPGFTNGVHTICLTIVDSLNNCFDQQCQTITVGGNNCYGYLSGQVFAGSNNQPLDEGMVYLILFDPLTNMLTAIDSMPLDSSNWYFFGPLACGDYLIKAAATSGSQYYSNYIPTYYGNSPFWGFAQTVSLAQANTQVTADVTLIAANNPGGPGFIGGDVTQGANKTDLGDALSGIQVMLFNLSGDAIAYAYTDENGQFGFSNLAYGTYQVYVEALSVQTIPAVVTIGPDQPSVDNVHILVSESLISTGIEEFDFDGAISDVYPNPVGNDASIRINLENEVMVNISILDLTGRMISTHTVSVAGGESTVSISASQLKDGYYFLNIQDVDGNFSVTRKFMRVD